MIERSKITMIVTIRVPIDNSRNIPILLLSGISLIVAQIQERVEFAKTCRDCLPAAARRVTTALTFFPFFDRIDEVVPKCQILELQPMKTAVLQGFSLKNCKSQSKITDFGTGSDNMVSCNHGMVQGG
jgi:hypothetical protein